MVSGIDVNSQIVQINNSTSAAYADKKNMGTSDLGQDAFLHLMMAQMKNQDPTKPTDSSQMMLQNAQFTQVNELQKMNLANTTNQAYSLMDKKVTILDPSDKTGGSILTGKISEVITSGSNVSVKFEGDTSGMAYPLKGIQSVADGGTTTGVTKGKKLPTSGDNQYRGLLNQYTVDDKTGQVTKAETTT